MLFIDLTCTSVMSWELLLHGSHTAALLQSRLPPVYVIPVPALFNTQCKFYRYNDTNALMMEHNHDHLMHQWIERQYNNTLQQATSIDAVYYLPFYIRDCFDSDTWTIPWKDLNEIITSFALKTTTFDLEKTFISASFPLDVPEWTKGPPNALIMNVFQIRYLRVDDSLTLNGRDIYVPYYVSFRHLSYSKCNYALEKTDECGIERSNLFFAPCKNAVAFMDTSRRWRDMAYSYLANISNAIVTTVMNESDFVEAMHSSDFCFIFPGDTSSSAKLYKATFAGCIPVVFISYYQQLPFSRFIDWELFTILVRKEDLYFKDKILSLVERLKKIRENKKLLLTYRLNLRLASQLFDWNKAVWPSVYHFILLELVFSNAIPTF